MLLVLIISFSLLVGRNYFSGGNGQPRSTIWRKVPPSWYEFYRRLLQSLESNFGVFLGGQLTVAVIYGILVGLFMSILGFPYTVTTACVCGLLMVIPFFGGPLSLLPPLLVSVGGKTERPIILLLIVLFVFQTVLLNVVLPKLVGGKAGIGPLMTLFVLLAGAQIGGIFGVLLAVPLAGVIKNMVEYLIGRIEEPENDTNLPGKESKQKAHFPPVNWHRKKQPSPVVNLEQNKTSEVEKAIEALAKATDD
jgi:predicted PurR-regulated permease PerM